MRDGCIQNYNYLLPNDSVYVTFFAYVRWIVVSNGSIKKESSRHSATVIDKI